MKPFITILLFILINTATFSQSAISNQFSSKIPASVTQTIDNLNNKAYNIFLTSPDAAHKIASEALLLSEKAGYDLGKGRSFHNIGLIYWSQSYYPLSLFYLKSAINYLPADHPLYLSDAHRALGRTYADLHDFKQALIQLDKAQHYAANNTGRLAEVYNERSYIYCLTNDSTNALAAAHIALRLNKSIHADKNVAVLYARLSKIYSNNKKYALALKYIDTAMNMGRVINNRRLIAYSYLQYAIINNGTQKYEASINFAKQAIQLARSLGIIDVITKAFDVTITSYEQKGDTKNPLLCNKEYKQISDSLVNLGKLKMVKLIQNYYDLHTNLIKIDRMEVQNNVNEEKIKWQNAIIAILGATLLLLAAMLIVTFYYYKQKKALNTELVTQRTALLEQKQLIQYQTNNLQKVNRLKDKLLAVIGHDLRTPIANLNNIVEMFDEGYISDNEVRELMRDMNPIVKGAQLTLSNLVEWAGNQIRGKSLRSSNVDVFLLGVEMEQTLLHALRSKQIEFINKAYPGQGVFADENHLKVILRNLISNAIKFTGQAGSITLSTIIDNNELIISVADNGKGMSDEQVKKLFFFNTHFSSSGTSGEKGTGIGLLLCKELVELNGGKLSVTSKLGEGSTFYFNVKMSQAYA